VLLALGACLAGGCGWNKDNPYDPYRCEPVCGAGQRCFEGRCVAIGTDVGADAPADDAFSPDDLGGDGARDATGLDICSPGGPGDAGAGPPGRVRHNTAIKLSGNVQAVDLDDDGLSEWITHDSEHVLTARLDASGACLIHKLVIWKAGTSSPDPPGTVVERVLVGRYKPVPGKPVLVCSILSTATLRCHGYNAAGNSMDYAWTQPFGNSGLEFITGDYDEDGKDELMFYRASEGNFRLQEEQGSSQFQDAGGSAGVFAQQKFPGRLVLAGNLYDPPGQGARDDLVLHEPTTGRLELVVASGTVVGETSWVLQIASAPGLVAAGEQVSVANLLGGAHEQVVLRDPTSGKSRVLAADGASKAWVVVGADPMLPALPGAPGLTLHWAHVLRHADEPGGLARTDPLLVDVKALTVTAHDARHCGAPSYLKLFSTVLPVVSSTGCP